MKISPFTIALSVVIVTVIVKKMEDHGEMGGHEGNREPEKKGNPRQGGWDNKKIADYNRLTGSHLKHGVNYDPITLEDFKRKGSWAVRHYKRKNGWQGLNTAPLTNEEGELLPFSTQAIVWGERPPKTRKDQKRLVRLGEKLLKVYHKYKDMGYKKNDLLPADVRKRFKKTWKK